MKHLLKVCNLSSNNMCEKLVGWKSLLIVDMKERCVMCGASDISLSHPDYCDWVCIK